MSNIKKKRKSDIKYIAIIIVSILIMLIAIIAITKILSKNKNKEQNNEQNSSDTNTEELSEENEIKNLTEAERMKRYIGIFFDDIENGDYKTAYNKLNTEFRNTYFPTLEDFKIYADRYLNSKLLGVTYDNIERLANKKTGNLYVIWTTLTNVFQPKLEEDQEAEQTYFVIVEYDYNNYEMSFSVKGVEENEEEQPEELEPLEEEEELEELAE